MTDAAAGTAPGARLRSLLASTPGALSVAGGGTPLEALCAEQAGFEAFYVSGYAVAAWRHGIPDVGLFAMAEIVDAVRAIAAVVDLPLIADADTGYGDTANVRRTVRELERAGVAAIQIEDQTWPKRCGHMDGKQVVDAADMARKVRAAAASRRDGDTLIIARTDARGPYDIHEAIRRCALNRQAGADILFVDAPESVDELRMIAESVPGPLLVNMSESGKTPILPAQTLGEMGYRIVIYPTSALRLAAGQILRLFRELRAEGSTGAWPEQMLSLDELNQLLGLDALAAFDRDVTSSSSTVDEVLADVSDIDSTTIGEYGPSPRTKLP